MSKGVIRINTSFCNNSYYFSAQDDLIQNAGGHEHDSTCKKLTCTVTFKSDSITRLYDSGAGFYIKKWNYSIVHSACGQASSTGAKIFTDDWTFSTTGNIVSTTHTYWSCGN